MRIGIAGTQTTELVAKSIKETLSDAGFESFYFKNNSKVMMADLIIVLGGDRGVRNYFHSALDLSLIHTPSPRDLSTSRMPSSA